MTETRLPKGLSGSNFPSSGAGWRGWRRRGERVGKKPCYLTRYLKRYFKNTGNSFWCASANAESPRPVS